jgi:hypothetical protein
MPDWVKGLLTVVICTVQGALTLSLFPAVILPALTHHPWDVTGWVVTGAIFGLLYGLEAGILVIYDLGGPLGWFQLLVDMTWSLPNTVFGFVFGNLIYLIAGSLSPSLSRYNGWIVYSGTFGGNVHQTLGTVNLGGAGQHERMHLLQSRLLGPIYLPFFAVNYVVNFVLQGLWTITLGAILAAAGARRTAYFRPPSSSVVGGFWGWIYYATLLELWAYSSGNP